MSRALLSVEGLSVTFTTPEGPVYAVREVSFELDEGEVLGIVGESGSGKTVTCRSLLGLLPRNAHITGGRIWFEGRDLVTAPEELPRLRGRKLAMIFQTPSTYLDPLMRVGVQIGESLRFHLGATRKAGRDNVVQLLRDVHIPQPEERVNAYPHELSGGMKQRVMIAGALASRPSILVADEPTTALDVTVQAEILRLLRELRAEYGLSIVLVSHDLGVIAEMCDRVVVMKDGQVMEQGKTTRILRQPADTYTRQLIASHASLEPQADGPADSPPGLPDDEPLLRVQNLSVTYGLEDGRLARLAARLPILRGRPPVEAVRDVSFAVQRGETLGIVGESGSGKSTIGRAIVRLVEPSSGRILYRESGLHHLRGPQMQAYRRAVQMVFQDPYGSLNPRMTVEQMLAEPLRVHRLCAPERISERIRELMEAVELSAELRHRGPRQLSGGQCQRVAIARALTMGPELLIADEITSSVDVTTQAQILELLEKLREQIHLTILFISHDLRVVHRLCENVLVMKAGQVVEYGSAREIMCRPRQPYTKQLIAAVPRLPA